MFGMAIIVSIALAFGFALLQLSLVFGAPFGEYVLGGQRRVLPMKMRIVSCFFSLFFVIVGVSWLQVAGAIDGLLHPQFTKALLIIHTLFLAYAIIGNGLITKSKKEKYVMTPISIAGFLCGLFVLLTNSIT